MNDKIDKEIVSWVQTGEGGERENWLLLIKFSISGYCIL